MNVSAALASILGRTAAPAAFCAVVAVMLAVGPGATQVRDPSSIAEKPDDEIQRFCGNIADEARDRRYSLQAAELQQLQKDVDERIRRLEEKRAEYEGWVTRRETFMQQAQANVVQIYTRMRPEAAAGQLTQLRTEMAASILMKLDPRVASVILNEMDMKAAATLTSIMVMAARPEDPS